MESNRHAHIDALAQEIFQEFRHYLGGGRGFAPVLFMHHFEESDEPALLEMTTLEREEQERWPQIIAEAVERCNAALWALATQVLVRRASKAGTSEELLFVYLVADAAHPEGARIFASPVQRGNSLPQPLTECTDDPNLQMMIAHLTSGRLLH